MYIKLKYLSKKSQNIGYPWRIADTSTFVGGKPLIELYNLKSDRCLFKYFYQTEKIVIYYKHLRLEYKKGKLIKRRNKRTYTKCPNAPFFVFKDNFRKRVLKAVL